MLQATGTFKARPIDARLCKTNSGKEQVAVKLQVIDGDHEGECAVWYGYFTSKALEWTIKSLRTMGFKGNDLFDLSSVCSEVEIVVETEEYDGRTKYKVRYINELGGNIRITPLSEGEARSFAERMRGELIAMSGGNDSSPRHDVSDSPTGENDDDLPF